MPGWARSFLQDFYNPENIAPNIPNIVGVSPFYSRRLIIMFLRTLFSRRRLLSLPALFLLAQNAFPDAYTQTNLVSSVPGLAAFTDANLRNPWGVSFSATSPFWTSNQATNTSTLYGATGAPNALVVSVPGGPTGQVFAGGTPFQEPNGTTPNFVFATLAGSIYAWNNGNGTAAQLTATTAGAVYTGLAIGSNASGSFLYAANVRGGTIDVFNSGFNRVSLAGSFVDPNLPTGYTPYNVQNINGLLYVEYENAALNGVGNGIVSVFDTNGVFQRRLISNGQLDQPWGIVIAPASWGAFANDLLVGNFGNGQINAFNPTTGAFVGTVTGSNGQPLVNSGLWALATRTGPGFDPNAVYFTAGINNEADGLLGSITPTPEPFSLGMMALGATAIIALGQRRSRT
jgi:uncharacterized protein (TIGR03118 family)